MKFILSIEKTINLFVCLSLTIILCNDLWWQNLPEMFEGGGKVLTLIYNVAMGYLVSYIFYLVVVRYKEYKNEIHINSVVIPLIKEVVKSQNLVNDCIKDLNRSELLNVNNKESFKSFLEKTNFNSNIPRVAGTFLYAPAEWADFLNGQKSQARKNIQRTFAFISHLEPELIKLLSSIDNSNLFISLIFVSKFDAEQRKQSMGDIADALFSYNQDIIRLSEYIKKREVA